MGFQSSIDVENLIYLESTMGALRSPKWPASVALLNQSLVKQGKTLYQQNCLSCHQQIEDQSLSFDTAKVPQSEPAYRLMLSIVAGTVFNDWWDALPAVTLDGEQPLEGPELMNYTAKALNGVWSSAPSSSGVAVVLTEKSLALTSANPS